MFTRSEVLAKVQELADALGIAVNDLGVIAESARLLQGFRSAVNRVEVVVPHKVFSKLLNSKQYGQGHCSQYGTTIEFQPNVVVSFSTEGVTFTPIEGVYVSLFEKTPATELYKRQKY